MSQTNVVSGGPGVARFCSACGGALPGPVQRCPRCGAVVGGPAKSRNSAVVIVVIAVAVLGAIPCLGIVAAIAIPNFIRYQLRAKESEVKDNLSGLVRAEQSQRFREAGVYVAIGPLPSASPGREMNAFSAADLEAARNLDWLTGPRTHGRYQVAVSGDGKAAALCAESDIDGDGVRAVHVAFLPSDQGEAPPAPCTEPVPYDGRARPGEVVQLSGNGVF